MYLGLVVVFSMMNPQFLKKFQVVVLLYLFFFFLWDNLIVSIQFESFYPKNEETFWRDLSMEEEKLNFTM